VSNPKDTKTMRSLVEAANSINEATAGGGKPDLKAAEAEVKSLAKKIESLRHIFSFYTSRMKKLQAAMDSLARGGDIGEIRVEIERNTKGMMSETEDMVYIASEINKTAAALKKAMDDIIRT